LEEAVKRRERETHEKKKRKREIRERHFNRRREEGKREI
jgi:hypothetical protein